MPNENSTNTMQDSQKYGRQQRVTEFIEPSECHGSAYDSFKNLLRVYRITGCCPVDGLQNRRLDDLKIRYSWYSLYSCVCVLLAISTLVEVMFDSGSRRSLEAKSNMVVSVIFATQSTVNFLIIMSRCSNFVLLLRYCAMFESRRPAPRSLVQRLRCLMLVRSAYCVLFFTPLISRRIYRTVVARSLLEFALRFAVTIGALYHLFWSTVAEWTLVILAHLLRGYLEEVIKDIRDHETIIARSRPEHQLAFLRKIRQDIRDIKTITQTANDTIQLGLVVTYGSVMACSCCSAFFIITTESSVELLMKVMAVGYVAQTFLTIAVATISSQAVTEQARELKKSLETFGKQKLPRQVARLLLTFQLCFDSDCFAFNACGFFTVELSIFKAMIGVVITYTLVLFQTKLTGVSVHSTECSNPDNGTDFSASKSM